jgi:hypothetical protein
MRITDVPPSRVSLTSGSAAHLAAARSNAANAIAEGSIARNACVVMSDFMFD